MPLKAKSFKEKQTEAERGRKRYLERLAQTREADKELKEFDFDTSPIDDELPRNTNK